MTEHLPECLMYDVKVCMCICLELRACEERMRLQAVGSNAQRILIEHGEDCWRSGYAKALDAAREAVALMEISVVGNSAATVDQALAVIDALKEKT